MLTFRQKKPIFGIHGGGNIGLGCMADIVASSSDQYHIVATSSDRFTNKLINTKHRYWLHHHDTNDRTCIDNVSMIYSRNRRNIAWLYTKASIIALCLTEKGLTEMINTIIDGLIKRHYINQKPLDILILMNKPKADDFVRNLIYKKMLMKLKDTFLTEKIMKDVRFIPTVVDRIVNKIERRKVLRELRKQLMNLNKRQLAILVDKKITAANKSVIIENCLHDPAILVRAVEYFNLKCSLFRAERNLMLFVPDNFKRAKRFPKVKTVKNINLFNEIKNKYINGPHSVLAWIGGLMGLETIAETIKQPSVYLYINKLMENEIGPILKAAFPSISHYELQSLKKTFIERCKLDKEDTVARVGRDPLRKLNRGERVRGILELKQKYNVKINTPELERGMAAGILYATQSIDPTNRECQTLKTVYEKSQSYREVLCYKGLYQENPYPGLDKVKDEKLINNILKRITTLKKIYNVSKMRTKSNMPITQMRAASL